MHRWSAAEWLALSAEQLRGARQFFRSPFQYVTASGDRVDAKRDLTVTVVCTMRGERYVHIRRPDKSVIVFTHVPAASTRLDEAMLASAAALAHARRPARARRSRRSRRGNVRGGSS